ncbi:hypothetical protein [Streptomyces brasiliensis]|uniref:Uncharacterized protein n=1 Tax=Streptomyces brasiliensis TaxID=1954 RepID=A0A917LBM3_9ACTN|nr:hypothetical protein [Streptomyces brasiliensis]GGJ56247.1 hypothetical protein GCM10010121_078550 [Streptomyces brasiliensis]
MADVAEIRPLLDIPQPVVTRVRVHVTAGQMAGMIAIVLHDLDAQKQAQDWFSTAAATAQEAGDRQLQAWVLVRAAVVPINYGAPQTAAMIAERAPHAAESPSTAVARLAAAVAARAYSLTHSPSRPARRAPPPRCCGG